MHVQIIIVVSIAPQGLNIIIKNVKKKSIIVKNIQIMEIAVNVKIILLSLMEINFIALTKKN